MIKRTYSGSYCVIQLLIAVLITLTTTQTYAAAIHETAVVRFNGDVVNIPSGRSLHLCDSLTIQSDSVIAILQGYEQVYVSRLFDEEAPDYIERTGRDGRIVKQPTLKGWYTLTFLDSIDAAVASVQLQACSIVYACGQNGLQTKAAVSPNDPMFSAQWSLYNSSDTTRDINATDAWEEGTGSSSQLIGILDSGVWGDHPDLAGKAFGHGVNQGEYHGTHVAGIAAAISDNSVGVAGVNWNARILSKVVLGTNITTGMIFDRVLEVVNEEEGHATVLNNSWGQYESWFGPSTLVAAAFVYAYNMDKVAVCAAGNNETSAFHFPSGMPNVVSVSATNSLDNLAGFSNYGPSIDIAAPGVAIVSTYSPTDPYEFLQGTSMAAPHVAGAASLIRSKYPDLWGDDVTNLLYMGAEDVNGIDYPGWDEELGWGRLDIRASLQLMQAPNHIAHQSSASGSIYSVSDPYSAGIIGAAYPADGAYTVKRYEIRKDVTFDRPFIGIPKVWGRGAASSGFSNSNPLIGYNHAEVVPGSITSNGCTVRAFVYEAWDFFDDPVGWVPCEPSEVSFGFSAYGESELVPVSGTQATPDFQEETCDINWTDTNPNEVGSVVQRKAGDGAYVDEATLDANETEWTETDLTQLTGGETYSYRIRPYTDNQSSVGYGTEATFQNIANPPQSVTVIPLLVVGGDTSQRMRIFWGAPANQKPGTIDHYKLKIVYKDVYYCISCPPTTCCGYHDITQWVDSIESTSMYLCAEYFDKDMDITVYAVDNSGILGRASQVAHATSGSIAHAGCYAAPEPDPEEKLAASNVAVLPETYELLQNYPNPFNPATSISVQLPEASDVTLDVFNSLGQRVTRLYQGQLAAGVHTFQWDGTDELGNTQSSGVYFYRVSAGDYIESKKMLLLK